jgi:hypothetical protein
MTRIITTKSSSRIDLDEVYQPVAAVGEACGDAAADTRAGGKEGGPHWSTSLGTGTVPEGPRLSTSFATDHDLKTAPVAPPIGLDEVG